MAIIDSMAKKNTALYTVSQLTALLKQAVENNLPSRVTVRGEIGEWRKHHSGHCYFTIKDKNAILPCVMWKSSAARLKFDPEMGTEVLATGHIDIYPPQGRYQFMADKIEPAGVGALQLAFEQMVKRLEAEGLFKDEHKKPLPSYPGRICIMTSESGAAIHDITDSIRNRWPSVKLSLYPVPVQGDGAAEKIASAIRDVNRRNKTFGFDVLIVGRGGGSMEDLWQFNEEILARAIFDSQIPIVSAVGHEVDVTIADLIADVRASTPTKAGIVAVPDADEVERLLNQLAKSMSDNLHWLVQTRQQQIDEFSFSLSDRVKDTLSNIRKQLRLFYQQVQSIEPHKIIGSKRIMLAGLRNRLNTYVKSITSQQLVILGDLNNKLSSGITNVANKKRLALAASENRLAALNPKSVLKRGYSITTDKITGKVIRETEDVTKGQVLVTELAEENLIESQVIKK